MQVSSFEIAVMCFVLMYSVKEVRGAETICNPDTELLSRLACIMKHVNGELYLHNICKRLPEFQDSAEYGVHCCGGL
jgi:hypothetical protein